MKKKKKVLVSKTTNNLQDQLMFGLVFMFGHVVFMGRDEP